MTNRKFKDRKQAGQELAQEVCKRNFENPVVLALPRGGVPVAYEIAKALRAPLDVVLVRKIGVPYQPELALAAVVNGDHPEIVVNEAVAAITGLDREHVDAEAERQLKEIERRREYYLQGRQQTDVRGCTAIVVDDGIATGASMRAALHALRRKSPKKVVLAVPVAPLETITALKSEADEIICLGTPEPFIAIGLHYRNFDQTPDEEVKSLLTSAAELSKNAYANDGDQT